MNTIINKEIIFKDLGITNYSEVWEYQEKLMNDIIEIKKQNKNLALENITHNYLLFTQHNSVYTLGKSGNFNHLLINEQKLNQINAQFIKTNRGGDITFHGLGQLVGYPILDLENFYEDIHKYMRNLEEIIILTLNDYGLKGQRSKGETGVWIDLESKFPRKICAMGVKSSRWVTIHGFAFNVFTDLSYFDYIVPCGIQNKGVTSLEKELNKKIDFDNLKQKVKKNFLEVFK